MPRDQPGWHLPFMTETIDIRPLDWRDLPLLHRLRDRGLCFDAKIAHTRGPHPLQSALLDAITPGRGELTLVAPDHDGSDLTAIGQLAHTQGEPNARIVFVGPASAIEEDHVLHLMDRLAEAVGRRGAHHLIADVDADSRAFEVLRRAGFAVYARQRIWRLDPERAPQPPVDGRWHEKNRSDESSVTRLYHNVVPGLVQQVEPPPGGQGLVHWNEKELHAYLDIARGPLGTWVQPYLHPAAQDHDLLLAAAFSRLTSESDQPVYLCVRSYQGWMNDTLARMGLTPRADQAVMVKRLTAKIREAKKLEAMQLEGTRPEPSAPFVPTQSNADSSTRVDQLTS